MKYFKYTSDMGDLWFREHKEKGKLWYWLPEEQRWKDIFQYQVVKGLEESTEAEFERDMFLELI